MPMTLDPPITFIPDKVYDMVGAGKLDPLIKWINSIDDPRGFIINDTINRPYSLLSCAASEGKIEIMKVLMDAGATNTPDRTGMYPIHHAACTGHTEAVELLLGEKPSLSQPDVFSEGGETPLMNAAQFGYEDVVALLLKHGADVNLRDEYGFTADYKARVTNKVDIADFIELVRSEGSWQKYWDKYAPKEQDSDSN